MKENVEKILNAPIPKTKRDVRVFLSAVGFVRKFIPNCAGTLKPITDLTNRTQGDTIKWNVTHQQAKHG